MTDNQAPLRWSASRIISAAVLLIVVLGAIAYGIYSLATGGGSKPNIAVNNSHSFPAPNSNTQPGSNSSPATSPGSGSAATNSTGSSSQTGTASTSNLSNTGPGDTALIGFMAAFIIGTTAHYGWRRLHSGKTTN